MYWEVREVMEMWLWAVVETGVKEGVGVGIRVGLLLLLLLGLALDLNENFCLGARALRAWESFSESIFMCYTQPKNLRHRSVDEG